jgi:hypothetical protein
VKLYAETLSVTPTVSTSPAHTANDAVTGLMTFSLSDYQLQQDSFEIRGARITDKSNQAANIVLVLFHTNPSNSTFTANSAFAVHANDLASITAVLQFTTHASFSANSVSYVDSVAKIARYTRLTSTTGALYGAAYTTGTPTYATTSALTFYLDVLSNQYGS